MIGSSAGIEHFAKSRRFSTISEEQEIKRPVRGRRRWSEIHKFIFRELPDAKHLKYSSRNKLLEQLIDLDNPTPSPSPPGSREGSKSPTVEAAPAVVQPRRRISTDLTPSGSAAKQIGRKILPPILEQPRADMQSQSKDTVKTAELKSKTKSAVPDKIKLKSTSNKASKDSKIKFTKKRLIFHIDDENEAFDPQELRKRLKKVIKSEKEDMKKAALDVSLRKTKKNAEDVKVRKPPDRELLKRRILDMNFEKGSANLKSTAHRSETDDKNLHELTKSEKSLALSDSEKKPTFSMISKTTGIKAKTVGALKKDKSSSNLDYTESVPIRRTAAAEKSSKQKTRPNEKQIPNPWPERPYFAANHGPESKVIPTDSSKILSPKMLRHTAINEDIVSPAELDSIRLQKTPRVMTVKHMFLTSFQLFTVFVSFIASIKLFLLPIFA